MDKRLRRCSERSFGAASAAGANVGPKSAFRQGGSHLAAQRPSIPQSNPGRPSHLLGPSHTPFGHPSVGHTDVIHITSSRGTLVSRFIHLAQCFASLSTLHLFPSNTVGSFTLIGINTTQCAHRNILAGLFVEVPRATHACVHALAPSSAFTSASRNASPAGTERSFPYPLWQVHCQGFKQSPCSQGVSQPVLDTVKPSRQLPTPCAVQIAVNALIRTNFDYPRDSAHIQVGMRKCFHQRSSPRTCFRRRWAAWRVAGEARMTGTLVRLYAVRVQTFARTKWHAAVVYTLNQTGWTGTGVWGGTVTTNTASRAYRRA